MNNLNINSYIGKQDGQPITAQTWNGVFSSIQTKVNEIIAAINNGGSGGGSEQPVPSQTNVIINGTTRTDDNIVLNSGSTYTIKGTVVGNITIDATSAQPNENTVLILDGVTIVSDENFGIKYETPVENAGYKDLVIILKKDTENYIICNKVVANADDQPAAIYSMNNLAIKGVGYLAVYNKGGHGIRGTELQIAGPHIYADTSHDAIHGKYIDLDCGILYVLNANDAVGTGFAGRVVVGDFELYTSTSFNGTDYDVVGGGSQSGTIGSVNDNTPGHPYFLHRRQSNNNDYLITTMPELQNSQFEIIGALDENFTQNTTIYTHQNSVEVYDTINTYHSQLKDLQSSSNGLLEFIIPNTGIQELIGENEPKITSANSQVNSLQYDFYAVVEGLYHKINSEAITLPYTLHPEVIYGPEVSYFVLQSQENTELSYSDNTITTVANSRYCIYTDRPYIKVSGYVPYQLCIPKNFSITTTDATTGDVVTSPKTNIYLQNAVLGGGVLYEPSDSRVKISTMRTQDDKDTYNVIKGGFVNYTYDAIKSENNVEIEVKNRTHLYITDCIDGIDGDDVKITDSKGTLIITGCAGRGIKGTGIAIGPDAEISSGVVTSIDTTSQLGGAVIITKNCTENTVSVGTVDNNNIVEGTGYADIYARQGKKVTKGTLLVKTDDNAEGVVIADSIGATIGYATNFVTSEQDGFYYNTKVDSNTIHTTPTLEQYLAVYYNSQTVAYPNGQSGS